MLAPWPVQRCDAVNARFGRKQIAARGGDLSSVAGAGFTARPAALLVVALRASSTFLVMSTRALANRILQDEVVLSLSKICLITRLALSTTADQFSLRRCGEIFLELARLRLQVAVLLQEMRWRRLRWASDRGRASFPASRPSRAACCPARRDPSLAELGFQLVPLRPWPRLDSRSTRSLLT